MTILPTFTNDGMLPVGDYTLTLEALRSSVLVDGPQPPGEASHWDCGWRLKLLDNLGVMVTQLWAVGITEIFIDGSFVEDKDHPNDIDGYFVCDLRRLAWVIWNGISTCSIRTRSGRGTRQPVAPIVDTRKSSSRCGASIASSCTRMSVS